MKKILCVLLSLIVLMSLFSLNAFAKDDSVIETLVKNGYTYDTASALTDKEAKAIYDAINCGKEVQVDTCIFEIDNLEVIRNFLSMSDEELNSYGFSNEEIKTAKDEIISLATKSDKELIEDCGLNDVEVKLLKMIYCEYLNGELNSRPKEVNNVSASGTISSSKMTYTQTATSNSSTLPNYTVNISYAWITPYQLAIFVDNIVVAWGGGLNSKDYNAVARYYNFTNTAWGTYREGIGMGRDVTPNTGIIFKLPQCVNTGKTKSGSVSFTLYQTKKEGKETTLISNYCHKVIAVTGGISISASGPSITIGTGWDKTPQRQSVIGY